jgi:transcription-repair coupling factor (superfamily II helicase)
MEKEGFSIKLNEEIRIGELAEKLSHLGYEKIGTSTPDKEGYFSSRGNLVDLWLERYKMPVRIDLIGEKIENLYLFNPITQTKIRNLKEVYIIPFGTTPKRAPTWATKAKFPVGPGTLERLFLSEIEEGDLVVHIDHGIGKYLGIVTNKLDGEKAAHNLVVEYAKGDKLFIPTHQIERLTKYIGAPGYKPKLNNLGTSGWEKVKSRVRESIVMIAQDLLHLYAKREVSKRPKYSADSVWQRQLEDSFEYQETEDQIKATDEIKKDLEGSKPMDRILVGDVGFGKTEVAIRASFKVIQEGKQVAVLVPTTLLAEQHYHLFKDRLEHFPVEIEMLSRFRNEKEQKRILDELKSGKVDIVIGTHRLLSSDVEFKKLGLLIVDEEHRFGVRHKEKLKSIRTSVDIFSMTATPIPRTLHMALTNLRDISVLREPPSGRKPIETLVGEFDEQKIKEAIKAELKRNGQVYYLFNNVAQIAKKASEVASLVPNARVVYAHGQMRERELEEAMEQFYSGKADMLVCTTIIGSGLDMPNVNTIIIENVQKFGLADIYQLRGRVGRSERKAYAHLFYPKGYVPSGDVLERLLAIGSASELGSGFKLAKKDLEIRGAGNLLGTAQHGNISLVGFELYIQLLSQAVEKLKSSAGLSKTA